MNSMKIEVLLTPFEAELVKALRDLLWKIDIPQQGMGLAREIFAARAVIAKSEGRS